MTYLLSLVGLVAGNFVCMAFMPDLDIGTIFERSMFQAVAVATVAIARSL